MKKLMVGLVVTFSLLFLFGGLMLVGAFSASSNGKKLLEKSYTRMSIEHAVPSMSMKQIDSLTARYNYNFTSANAGGISVYSVMK